jgi:phage shock protein A
MGILGRIQTVIRSNVNSMLDKMTDPAKEIDYLIQEMEDHLKKAREEVISCAATAKRAGQRARELETELERWQRRAEQAVRAGDDGLAREALQQRVTVEREHEAAGRLQQEQEAYVEQLKSSLKALEARITEVKGRKEMLKARARAAREGRPVVGGGKPFEDFRRLEDRIEAMEAEGDLSAATDARAAAVEGPFARLGPPANPEVEDALAELKRRLGSGEGSGQGEPGE